MKPYVKLYEEAFLHTVRRRNIVALSELIIKQAKPRDKRYTLSDGRGLILEVHPNGRKYWIVRLWRDGKERRKAVGVFPDVPLKAARERAQQLRSAGPDVEKTPSSKTFADVALEWLRTRMLPSRKPGYTRTVRIRLEKYILPELGDLKLNAITSGTVLHLCQNIEAHGTIETAARVRQIVGQVFRYAVATDRADADPTAALRGALQTRVVKHMATITDPQSIAALMRNIAAYPRFIVRCALRFSALTFCRPGEIRHAEWSEIDLGAAEWRIPAEKMKMKRMHIVPLARQTVALLEELREVTGRWRYVFPSARMDGRPMSENTVRVALRTMGYGNDEMTAHGFRGMASTRLNEMGWAPDVIERQLAHLDANKVRAAYNHAEYLAERREMMQAWADWLEAKHRKLPSSE